MASSCLHHAVLLALCGQSIFGHFLWLKEQDMNEAIVTFSEKAGAPGPSFFLPMIASKIQLSLSNSSGKTDLPLAVKNTSAGMAELTTALDSALPCSVNLAATFGIFNEDPTKPVSLLKYYASADMVRKPNDWFQVQDWSPQKGLEITIRDPWMKRPNASDGYDVHAASASPGDQCAPHQGPEQDGDACVVAVVRFNGHLLDSNVNVTTFTADGAKYNATFSSNGVVILKLPLNKSLPFTEAFAAVNYREPAPGVYDGKNYSIVDHWATTYVRLARVSVPAPVMI